MAIFKGSYLFQTIILGIQPLVFRGVNSPKRLDEPFIIASELACSHQSRRKMQPFSGIIWQCMETTESSWSSEGKAVNICFLGVNYTNMAWQKSHPGECTSLALPLEEMPSSAFFSANKIIPNAFLFIFYIRKDTNKHTQRPFPK